MRLGAHLSTAGGLSTALDRARELRCTAVQIFTHSRAQWRMPPLDAAQVERFRRLAREQGPYALAAHASYLINVASPERALRERSIRTLTAEVRHCATLGIPLLVFHPGAHMGAGERRGIARVARALDRVFAATADCDVAVALETTAGQGTGLGHRFSQLAEILARLASPARARICFDTAHAFAAGYELRRPEQYTALWERFDQRLGLDRLALFHFNDSRTPCGSRVDRHAHIGRGEIGSRPFGWLLADARFARVPKVLETPKENEMDRRNLRLLRRLATMTPRHRGRPRS